MSGIATQVIGRPLVGQLEVGSGVRSCSATRMQLSGTGMAETLSTDPIEMRGESVVFKPENMMPGKSYPFEFRGVSAVAIKRTDGSIDFFHIA